MIENFMWMPYPYVRYTFCLVSGILMSGYVGAPAVFEILFVVSTAAFTITFLFRRCLPVAFCHNCFGFLGMLIIFGLGEIRFEQNDHRNNPGHLTRLKDAISHYTATVTGDAVNLKHYSKVRVSVNTVKTQKGWQNSTAKALLYLKQDTPVFAVEYGDRLLLKGSPGMIKGSSNPGAFDYQNYMALQNVFHQHFVSSDKVVKYDRGKPNFILYKAIQVKKGAKSIIDDAVRNQREKSIVMSLLIGERATLDTEVKKIYSEVGAMHVLAVSGLHVGIVYLLLSIVLGFLKKDKKLKWLFLVICLMALWFYAMLTGLSTSVLRAVVMFTLILLGDTLGRKSNIYNNIALAAFLLLLFDPNYLFQVGFQLSFAAVTGIVYLQPKIAAWFRFKNMILDKIWQLTAVSLAAQLATFPISLYYFHQFPTYFWLTNLLVIPSATVTVILGIIVLFLGSLDMAAAFFSGLLEKVVFFTNEGLALIHTMPLSSIRDLYFTTKDMLLIYAVIIVLIRFLCTFKIHYLGLSLFLLGLFSSENVLHYLRTLRQRQIVFYDINKICAIDFIDGRAHHLLLMANHQVPLPDLHASVVNHRLVLGLNSRDLASPKVVYNDFQSSDNKGFEFFYWKGLVFLLLNKTMSFYQDSLKKINIDYLVINNQAIRDFDQIAKNFEFKRLIITNLNPSGYASELYNYCLQNQISVHSVVRNGALVENIGQKNNLD